MVAGNCDGIHQLEPSGRWRQPEGDLGRVSSATRSGVCCEPLPTSRRGIPVCLN